MKKINKRFVLSAKNDTYIKATPQKHSSQLGHNEKIFIEKDTHIEVTLLADIGDYYLSQHALVNGKRAKKSIKFLFKNHWGIMRNKSVSNDIFARKSFVRFKRSL
ncbi:hypothetical protein ACLEIY_03065 [Acetobacter tropicalis]|uniref:hypothetical protein n=1 Tax=Acetobacter TaxID=434 RepID=UPI000A5A5610|nr:hypothetical protein [Acetobacter senegalensis]MCG4258970.1 hypothetical protein [Acetobacter senegalensis]